MRANIERFEEKFIPEPNSGCWLWFAASVRGYGHFRFRGRQCRAHRVAYEMFIGPIPSGFSVLHDCDTPSCVNPQHLRLGTQADNMRDMMDRGRTLTGSRNHSAKLTEDDVLAIRATTGCAATVAAAYGVNKRTRG